MEVSSKKIAAAKTKSRASMEQHVAHAIIRKLGTFPSLTSISKWRIKSEGQGVHDLALERVGELEIYWKELLLL